jgi:hypothetical protein
MLCEKTAALQVIPMNVGIMAEYDKLSKLKLLQ